MSPWPLHIAMTIPASSNVENEQAYLAPCFMKNLQKNPIETRHEDYVKILRGTYFT